MSQGRVIGKGAAEDFTVDELLRLLFDAGAIEGQHDEP